MEPLYLFAKGGVYAVMLLAVVAAAGAVTLRNVFHSALCLAAVLIGVAGIYVALQAEFLAMVQVLIYVGAVATLIIFAVMLTERLGDRTLVHRNSQSVLVFTAAAGFLIILSKIILTADWPLRGEGAARLSVQDLGLALMSEYIFPFEVIGIVLFAALIGAIVVARRDAEK